MRYNSESSIFRHFKAIAGFIIAKAADHLQSFGPHIKRKGVHEHVNGLSSSMDEAMLFVAYNIFERL